MNEKVTDMLDVACIAIVIGFFWIGTLYVRAADRL